MGFRRLKKIYPILIILTLLICYVVYFGTLKDSIIILSAIEEDNNIGLSKRYPIIPPSLAISYIKYIDKGIGRETNLTDLEYPRLEYVLSYYAYSDPDKVLRLAEYFLRMGDDINQRGPSTCNSLQRSIIDQEYEVVKFLIINGAIIRKRDIKEGISIKLSSLCDISEEELSIYFAGKYGTPKSNNILSEIKKAINNKGRKGTEG